MSSRSLPAHIVALAVPAFIALIAEPLFVLADTAIIGHVGTAELAGVGIAASILSTAVGLCIFLAYACTTSVSTLLGRGEEGKAVQAGIASMWLALGVGVGIAMLLALSGPWLIHSLGAEDTIAEYALTYLRICLIGLPFMLVCMASVGVLRGYRNTITPMYIATVAAAGNAVANVVLVMGLGLGVAGSAIGTALTQILMGLCGVWCVVRTVRGHSFSPSFSHIRASALTGFPLMLRSLFQRLCLVATVAAAASLGPAQLAGHHIVFAVWMLLSFAHDALATAGQTLIAHAVGSGDRAQLNRLTRSVSLWVVGIGAILGVIMAVLSFHIGRLFTTDTRVLSLIVPAFLIVAASQPLAAYVFYLDGVVMGVGRYGYLAWASALVFLLYAPILWWVSFTTSGDVFMLWCVFAGVFMGARALTLALYVYRRDLVASVQG